jgi:hypothetical protein
MCDPQYFSITSAKDLYYPEVSSLRRQWIKGEQFFYRIPEKGRSNIRATAEMVWALEVFPE